MSYIEEASSWRVHKRHRQQITLVAVLLILVITGGIGYAVYSGAIGGPETVDVAKLPACSPTAKALLPEQVSINVYNATTRNGLAASTATALGLRSFGILTYANDPRAEKVTGTRSSATGPRARPPPSCSRCTSPPRSW